MKNTVERALQKVRRRIQIERVVKGLALLLLYGLVASVFSTYLLAEENFSEGALFWVRLVGSAGFLFLLIKFVALPLIRPPSSRRIARFLEERYPLLRERVSTAIETSRPSTGLHPDIRRLVLRDAGAYLRRINWPRFYWPRQSTASLTASVLSVAIIAAIYFGGPEVYRYSLNKMFWGWGDQKQSSLYQVHVSPGDSIVVERSDVLVQATLVGFEAADARVFARYEQQPQWESARMTSSLAAGDFEFSFFDVREQIEYYVEADGITSEVFKIEVSDLPRVETVTVTLDFPDYTGMADATFEAEGPIRALQGTSVHLAVKTNQEVAGGALHFDESPELDLAGVAPDRLEASFELSRDDLFRVHLINSEGISGPGSNDYLLEVLKDQPPMVSLTRPGRDTKVTNIEEVYTEVRAEDDYGIRRVELHYSVNGGPVEKVRPGFRRGSKKLTTGHTLFMEEMELQPGDFVSYFASATDAVTTSTSDIYFLEVEPFTRDFRQSQRSGGAGGQDGMKLAQQQKQIVVATFSLVQDKEDFSAAERKENSLTLSILQQRLRSQADTVAERIRRREAAMEDPRLKRLAEYLETASEHMKPAEEKLAEVQPAVALPEEQKALQQLLRAEALFSEVEVSMSTGASGDASLEELVDLVDLELDRTKNQYETLQVNQGERKEQALDEALEKLKELSKRQEQQLERQRRDRRAAEESLADEVEKLARELARLSREQQEQKLSELSRELERAARNMRQAMASGQTGEQSMAAAQQAMKRMQRAQDALSRQRRQQMESRLDELESTARQLQQEQRSIVRELSELETLTQNDQVDQEFLDKLRGLLRKKGTVQEELQDLEGQLHQTARQLESGQKESARRLKQAGSLIRDNRLPEKMEEGTRFAATGLMNMARHREEGIGEDLRQLADHIKAAGAALGQEQQESDQETRQRALGEIGDLVEKLASLEERLGPQSPGQESEEGEEGEQGAAQGSGVAPGRTAEGEQFGDFGDGREMRQLNREWQERLDEAGELREMLSRDPELAPEISQILRRMRSLDMERLLNSAEELAVLKAQVIEGLLQLELEVSRSLEEESSYYFAPVGEDEVPGEYRESVEEYHRRLSAGSPGSE